MAGAIRPATHPDRVQQTPSIPQLFVMFKEGRLTAILGKIADELLVAGDQSLASSIIDKIEHKLHLGTIFDGPGLLRYFGLNVRQHEDMTIQIDGDDTLGAI